MDAATRRTLVAINRRFYRHHAAAFSRSRQHGWPGWERLLVVLPPSQPLTLLDVGCGNGRLARWLAERGRTLALYKGIDGSAELIAEARRQLTPLVPRRLERLELEVRDVTCQSPEAGSPVGPRQGYDGVALMAVLHHVPGREERRRLLLACARATAARGVLIASLWRWDRAEDWQRRRYPWERYERQAIDPEELEEGDHLLTFQGDTAHPRYCHLVDDAETRALVDAVEADADGLCLYERFAADGRGGAENEYLVFRRPNAGR